MKPILFVILLLITLPSFGQDASKSRKDRRQARKEARHVYKSGELPGVNYPRFTIKPRTTRWILITVCIGLVAGEEFKKLKPNK